MSNVQNVELGPCSISVNGVDVGHTTGGSTLNYKPTYHDTVVDKFGKSVVEKWLVSEELSVEATLAEFTFDNLQRAIPQGIGSNEKITIGSQPAKRLSATAAVIVLHPDELEDGDRSGDVVLYKGVVTGPIAVDYKADGERLLKVVFESLIDEGNADGNLLGLIGDSTT